MLYLVCFSCVLISYTPHVGQVAVDVSGVQAKVELPQPSRLETLYVQMEQVKHVPTYSSGTS